jgi:hypothetical protein
MRWVDHVAPTEEERCVEGFGGVNLREGQHLEDPEVGRRIILDIQ